MCFNQEGDISTLNGGSLKLVDKFLYLASSVSSTESDINMRLAKAWTVINRLSIIWKFDQSDKIKQFLPSSGCINSTIWMQHMDADKAYWKKARQELHKYTKTYIRQILEATSHETAAVRPLTSYILNPPVTFSYPYHPSLPAGFPNYTLSPYRADVDKACCSVNTDTSMCWGPWKNITYELIFVFPAVFHISCSSYLDVFY